MFYVILNYAYVSNEYSRPLYIPFKHIFNCGSHHNQIMFDSSNQIFHQVIALWINKCSMLFEKFHICVKFLQILHLNSISLINTCLGVFQIVKWFHPLKTLQLITPHDQLLFWILSISNHYQLLQGGLQDRMTHFGQNFQKFIF